MNYNLTPDGFLALFINTQVVLGRLHAKLRQRSFARHGSFDYLSSEAREAITRGPNWTFAGRWNVRTAYRPASMRLVEGSTVRGWCPIHHRRAGSRAVDCVHSAL